MTSAPCACTGTTVVSRQADWPKAFTEIRVLYEISGDGPFDEALVFDHRIVPA